MISEKTFIITSCYFSYAQEDYLVPVAKDFIDANTALVIFLGGLVGILIGGYSLQSEKKESKKEVIEKEVNEMKEYEKDRIKEKIKEIEKEEEIKIRKRNSMGI